MRKRFEEELSKLAFGDLDAEEARRLEMQTLSNPEASETFQTYCRMKEELRSLAEDVPADQLSKERLREAILSRGMKEQLPRAAKPNWIWMPAMAAVLAFGVVFVKGQLPLGGKPNTVVVDNSTINPDVNLPKFDVTPPTTPDPVVAHNKKPSLVVEKEPVRVASNVGRRSSREDRINEDSWDRTRNASAEGAPILANAALKALPGEEDTYDQTVSFASEKKEGFKADPSVPAPMTATGASAPKPTMVLIQPETDEDTGTLRAREVSSTANVVVGG